MNRRFFLACLCGVLSANSSLVRAEESFPAKPLRIIVPFGPGSGADGNARYFADKMAPILGQPIVVENKQGADGAIGMALAKAEPADGYTIVQGTISAASVNVVLKKDLPYDPVNDFKPLFGYQRGMNVVLVSNESKFKTLEDLIAASKAASAPLLMGTFSPTLELSASWMGSLAGITFSNVPYSGQSQVITQLMGNHLDVALLDLGGASTVIRGGKVRALAVTGEARHPDFPDVPTVNETKGMGSYAQYSWNGFFIRNEVPDSVHAKLADAVKRVMTSPETIEKFYKPKGSQPVPVPSEEVRAMQLREIKIFREVAASVGMKPE
jgi:tripartite-type tricarboxylate transporter receptor subunit TctC